MERCDMWNFLEDSKVEKLSAPRGCENQLSKRIKTSLVYEEELTTKTTWSLWLSSASAFKVTVGDYDRSSVDGREQQRDVSDVIVHPFYTVITHDYDVMLIKLKVFFYLFEFFCF